MRGQWCMTEGSHSLLDHHGDHSSHGPHRDRARATRFCVNCVSMYWIIYACKIKREVGLIHVLLFITRHYQFQYNTYSKLSTITISLLLMYIHLRASLIINTLSPFFHNRSFDDLQFSAFSFLM